RVSVHKNLSVARTLMANELVAPGNHHQVRNAADVTTAQRFLSQHYPLKDRKAIIRRFQAAECLAHFFSTLVKLGFGYDPFRFAPGQVAPDALILSEIRAGTGPVDLVEKAAPILDLSIQDIAVRSRESEPPSDLFLEFTQARSSSTARFEGEQSRSRQRLVHPDFLQLRAKSVVRNNQNASVRG